MAMYRCSLLLLLLLLLFDDNKTMMLARRMEQGNGQRQRQWFPFFKCIITSAGSNIHFGSFCLRHPLRVGGGDEGNKNKRIKQTGRLHCSALTNVRLFKTKSHFSSRRELLAVTADYCHYILKRLFTFSKMKSREMIDSKILKKRLRLSMQRSSSLKQSPFSCEICKKTKKTKMLQRYRANLMLRK